MYPPHLPPPTCTIPHHRQWQRLKLIFAATFFGLLAGLTGAIVAIALVWPSNDVTTGFVSRLPRASTDAMLSDRVVGQLNNTIFQVYRKMSSNQTIGYLAPQDKIGDAVVGVSSGWLVTVLPGDLNFKDWRILGPNGTLYKVERILSDKYAGLLYIKIASLQEDARTQEQFKVAHFASSPEKPNQVFVRQGGYWEAAAVRSQTAGMLPAAHLDMISVTRLTLNSQFTIGSVVVDEDGVVIGLVGNDQSVVATISVISALTGIETRTAITYPTFGVEGWFSEEWPLIVNGERVTGFLVVKVTGKTPLKKGDIVLEVNDRPVTFSAWWAIRTDQEAKVTVLRNQQSLELALTR